MRETAAAREGWKVKKAAALVTVGILVLSHLLLGMFFGAYVFFTGQGGVQLNQN